MHSYNHTVTLIIIYLPLESICQALAACSVQWHPEGRLNAIVSCTSPLAGTHTGLKETLIALFPVNLFAIEFSGKLDSSSGNSNCTCSGVHAKTALVKGSLSVYMYVWKLTYWRHAATGNNPPRIYISKHGIVKFNNNGKHMDTWYQEEKAIL